MEKKMRSNSVQSSFGKTAAVATALSLAGLAFGAPALANSHIYRHGHAYMRHAYVSAPDVGANGDPGYRCGIGIYYTPLPCVPTR
jgi:hypothetical protein